MRKTTKLKQLIESDEILVLPGVYDALGAKIAENTGFEAITMGGSRMSAISA